MSKQEKFSSRKKRKNQKQSFTSVVSIDKARLRKPIASIIDESSFPEPAKSLVANDPRMFVQIRQ